MTTSETLIEALVPVVVSRVPIFIRKIFSFLLAEVSSIPAKTSVQISNSIAYGSFAFSVRNKRFALTHDKYCIPFLTGLQEAQWRLPDRYGEIDLKNRLILELDNIPRGQTVTVYVDVECPVDTEDFVRVQTTPLGAILSVEEPECEVEVMNNREFKISGFKVELDGRFMDSMVEITPITENRKLEPLPQEYVIIMEERGSDRKRIVFDIDLDAHEGKRFRVQLMSNEPFTILGIFE